MNFKILHEDDSFLVVDKPAGLVVNKSGTAEGRTLQDELADYFDLKAGDLGIGERAGIVHRLDRETSGLLIVAKTKKLFDYLQEEFKARRVKKEYIALVHGHVKDDHGYVKTKIGRIGKFGKFGEVDRLADGREAETEYIRISNFKFQISNFQKLTEEGDFNKPRIRYLTKHAFDYSLLRVLPKTGRTHQIRVHLKGMGNPVVSDLIYSPGKLLKFDLAWCPRLFLHAAKIVFNLKGKKHVVFESPLPYDLVNSLAQLAKLPDGTN